MQAMYSAPVSVICRLLPIRDQTNEAIRKASTDCTLKGFEVLSALNANRALYDRMSQVGLAGMPETKVFTVNYWKQGFQKSGIGKDQTTR